MRRLSIVILFASAAMLFAGSRMTLTGVGAVGTSVSSITCSGTCWAGNSCSNSPGNCSAQSTAQAITVPAGNSGSIKFNGGYTHTVQYSDNGGAFTGIADNGTVTWTTGHTMAVKILGMGCDGDGDTVVVTDNTTSASIGSFSASNNGVCP
jgi:hypothetical protein